MLFHCCMALDTLLKLTLEGEKVITKSDGSPMNELEIYQFVREHRAAGHRYFSPCDNVDAEGRCIGHKDNLPTHQEK